MKITAWPCSFSRAEHLRQLGDALRRQHRGRLVEDQHARAAPERLDDLDLLLVAERRGRPAVASGSISTPSMAASSARRLRAPAASSRSRRVSPSIRFSSTVSAGISVECWWTVPIPSSSAVRGDEIAGLDALDPDRAGVGRMQAGEDADQRRLAGSVLAEQAVHLAPSELQVDAVVREHARERLRDADQLDDRRWRSARASTWVGPASAAWSARPRPARARGRDASAT